MFHIHVQCKSCNWSRIVKTRYIAIEIAANHTRKSGHYFIEWRKCFENH